MFYSMQQQQTISQSDCDVRWKVDFTWQPMMTKSVVGLRRSSKTLPKANLHQKKFMVTVWWSTTAFWSLVKPLNLRSMLSKLMWSTGNCNACSQYWSTEWAQFFTTPNHMLQNTSNVEQIGLQSFALSTMFTWPLANWLPFHLSILRTFCRENASTASRRQKMLPQPSGGGKCSPRVCWISKHRFLCYRNKQAFLVGKDVLNVMVPILINKGVFEPSYSDLKFTIRNRSYFFTNLILG